jgi:hypothetical protein
MIESTFADEYVGWVGYVVPALVMVAGNVNSLPTRYGVCATNEILTVPPFFGMLQPVSLIEPFTGPAGFTFVYAIAHPEAPPEYVTVGADVIS